MWSQKCPYCGSKRLSFRVATRNVMWNGKRQRVDHIGEELNQNHPESFRHRLVRCRNGNQREI